MNVIQGCTCCGSCDIADDAFTRSDGTDIDTGSTAGWTEVSGSWAIATNALECTSAGIAICDTPHPDSLPQSNVTATAYRTADGTASILLGYVDSSNYYEVRYTIGTGGKIDIIRVSGGSSATLATVSLTIATSTTHTIAACFSEDNYITAFLAGTARRTAYVGTSSGDQVGFKAGSGTTRFDSFDANKVSGACDPCDPLILCSDCNDPDPYAFEVTLSGFTGGACDCPGLNVTYYLQNNGGCNYVYYFPSITCGMSELRLNIQAGSYIEVFFYNGTGVNEFRYTLGTAPYDCFDWNALDVPYYSTSGSMCVSSSATCTITALYV